MNRLPYSWFLLRVLNVKLKKTMQQIVENVVLAQKENLTTIYLQRIINYLFYSFS